MCFGEVYRPHRVVSPWAHLFLSWSLSCLSLLLTASISQAALLQDAIQTVVHDIWAGDEIRTDDLSACVVVISSQPDRLGETRICGGLLVSALQRRSSDVEFRLGDPQLSDTARRASSLTEAALQQLAKQLECDLLIAGELIIQDALGILQVTLWNLAAGHASDLAEAVFDVPASWDRSDTSSELPYALQWRSRVFARQRFLAVAIGDFDGDASNDVALATESRLLFQHWVGRELRTSDIPSKVYWDDVHRQQRTARERRTLYTLHSKQRDQLLVSVPTNWNATAEELQFEQNGMVVAVSGDQVWRTHLMVDPSGFSGEKTVQNRYDSALPQSMPQDYHALWITDVDDTPEQEYLLINPHGSLCIYRQRGTDLELWWQSPPYFGTAFAVGDLNGNLRPEIVCTSRASDQSDQISVLEWDGRLYAQRAQWDMPGPVQAMTIGDVDNDDIEELLVVVAHPLGSVLYLYHTRFSNPTRTSNK